MKYATLDNGTPDGQLALLSDDGQTCRLPEGATLQSLLDGAEPSPQGAERPFDATTCLSPLPRACPHKGWCPDGLPLLWGRKSGMPNHHHDGTMNQGRS